MISCLFLMSYYHLHYQQTLCFHKLKIFQKKAGVTKNVEYEDTQFISSHVHTKITTICRATINENDLKNSRKYFPQLKI